MVEAMEKECKAMDDRGYVCYFLHVSLGWDNNIRYKEFTKPVLENATPNSEETALFLNEAVFL